MSLLLSSDIIRNTFYERDGWFAFLDGTPITRGHTILTKRQLRAGRCPVPGRSSEAYS
jgi:diadenosine tetraphosphate (Ap4A) HIT family hydrolase